MMKIKKILNFTKKVVAGCLAAAVIVAGIVVVPKTAKAEGDIVKDGITYSPMDMATYWSESAKTAPVKADHVFAGWYTADESNNLSSIKEADGIPSDTTTYAKFVPAYVLSVKTQVEKKAEMLSTEAATKVSQSEDFSTFMRVLSSVDSGDYQDVGFEILLGDKETVLKVAPITKVYEGLKLSATDENAIKPDSIFGSAAKYFTALDMKNISIKSFSSKIYIRPYWTTLDGTKVEGLAKNVRVEDKYTDYRYISVPVNLLTDGAKPTGVAAGMVEVSYDPTMFDVATDTNGNKKIDTGKLLKDMDYVVDSVNGKITFVGSATNVNDDVKADGLYANIRFIRKPNYSSAEESDLALTKTVKEFCDWEENSETVIAW